MTRAAKVHSMLRASSAAVVALLLVHGFGHIDEAAAQGGFDLRRGSLTGSGGQSSGGNFVARTTTSQPDAGATTGGGFAVSGSIAQGDPSTCSALVGASGVVASANICSLVRVSWFDNSSHETGYRVRRNGQEIGIAGASATTFDDVTAAPGVTYSYTVVATNACGDASASETAAGRRPFPPQAPTGVRVTSVVRTADSVVVGLAWNDNSANEESQTIYRTDSSRVAVRTLAPNATATQVTFSTGGDARICLTVTATNCGIEAASDSLCFNTATVSVSPGGVTLPTAFALQPFAPNPFGAAVTIGFDVPRAAVLSLRVYDVAGRARRTLRQGLIEPGRYTLRWDGRDDAGQAVASGVYFLEMKSPGFRKIGRLIHVQ